MLFVLLKGNDIIEGYSCVYSNPGKMSVEQLVPLTSSTTQKLAACFPDSGTAFNDAVSNGIVPNNNEYEYSKSYNDYCWLCTNGSAKYGNVTSGGGDCWGSNILDSNATKCAESTLAGTSIDIKRKSGDSGYTADKNKCCSKSVTNVDGKTCDPAYRSMNSGKCVDQLASLCGTASGFSSNKDTCRNFCSVEIQNGKTTCDKLIYTYCESDSGKSDTSCDCINNYSAVEESAKDIGIYGDTICIYDKCQSGFNPLLTKAMTIKDCSICNAIVTNNSTTDNTGSPVTFTATCNIGDSSGGPTSISTTSESANMITSLGDFSGGFSSWITTNWIMLTIFTVVLTAIIIAIFFML